MLDNCISGHKIIPGDSYCIVNTLQYVWADACTEVHVSTHEKRIELKQLSFPLKPNKLFSAPCKYLLLSQSVIGFI